MIIQIATRSGKPPSEIVSTWTIDELQNAAALADLEAWGQAKRLVARLCAEIHNAVGNAVYATHGGSNTSPPKAISESLFLPRRGKAKLKIAKSEETKKQLAESHMRKTASILNSLAGF